MADWREIEKTPGVRAVMRHADYELVKFREKDISDIARIEEALNDNPISAAEGIPLKVGQAVRICRGVFENHRTHILHIDSKRKICVEVPFLGSTTKIVLPVSDIEAV